MTSACFSGVFSLCAPGDGEGDSVTDDVERSVSVADGAGETHALSAVVINSITARSMALVFLVFIVNISDPFVVIKKTESRH